MSLHPATRILIWCAFVAAMQFLPPVRMLASGGMVLFLALFLSRQKLLQLFRRTRWVMISLWLIYAYTTPGQALFDSSVSPTKEGLLDGGLQLMRLLVALAGLAMLLERLHRQQLIAGLYSLLAPLQWFSLSREKLAIRLALTLQYAEAGMLRPTPWRESLQGLMEKGMHAEDRNLELPLYRYSLADLISGCALLMLWIWLK